MNSSDVAGGRPVASGPASGWDWVRLVGNVANLTTPAGLLVARIGRAHIYRGPRGLFLAEGYRLKFPVASAFTVGSVIITGSSWEAKLRRSPQLLAHEEKHTWQYLVCLGFPFYPLYGACMIWSMLRTGDRAAGNFFERQAGLHTGGYVDHPVRPVSENLQALFAKRPISRS